MHVTIDCRFWGPLATGLGRYTKNLVLNLKDLSYDTAYTLIIDPQNAPFEQDFDERFKLIPIAVQHHSLKEQWAMTSVMLKTKTDLFHFPHYIVPIINGHKPFVVTIHDIIKHKFPGREASTLPKSTYGLKYQFYKITMHNAVKDSRHIIVDSEHVKNDLINWLNAPEQKLTVIPLAADDQFQAKINLTKYTYTFKPKSFILAVGNAYPYKNVETIIQALDLLPPEIQLVLVGTRDVFIERLAAFAGKIKVEKRVHFLGFVDDLTLSYLYQTAFAYVSASLEEGFGIQPLEAMKLGCPVVLSDIPTYQEICGEAAVYFDPSLPRSLAEALNSLNNQTLLDNHIKLGLALEKQYSWRRTAEETHQVYEQVFANL